MVSTGAATSRVIQKKSDPNSSCITEIPAGPCDQGVHQDPETESEHDEEEDHHDIRDRGEEIRGQFLPPQGQKGFHGRSPSGRRARQLDEDLFQRIFVQPQLAQPPVVSRRRLEHGGADIRPADAFHHVPPPGPAFPVEPDAQQAGQVPRPRCSSSGGPGQLRDRAGPGLELLAQLRRCAGSHDPPLVDDHHAPAGGLDLGQDVRGQQDRVPLGQVLDQFTDLDDLRAGPAPGWAHRESAIPVRAPGRRPVRPAAGTRGTVAR